MKQETQIIALGFFDGVHRGHQELLHRCVRLAQTRQARAAAITFLQHPQSLFTPEPPMLINTAADRERLLRQYGMEAVYKLPVTKEVMSTSWQDFLGKLLDRGAAGFVCGSDFRFGYRGEGDAEKLHRFCAERSLPCVIVPEQQSGGQRICSTRIRHLLETGSMEEAVALLGHPHIFTGTVVSGRKLGRTIGIPTANLWIPEGILIPKFGVYACMAEADGIRRPAVTNVGTRPTVGGHRITVEPWILDFDGDLYGRELSLEFYRFLRPEQKFDSLEALQRQIRRDAAETERLLCK